MKSGAAVLRQVQCGESSAASAVGLSAAPAVGNAMPLWRSVATVRCVLRYKTSSVRGDSRRFWGFPQPARAAGACMQPDVLVVPSVREAFAMVVPEAMLSPVCR